MIDCASIAVIRQEMMRTQQAPPPIAEVKQKAREYIEALQARGRPRIISTADMFEVSFVDLNRILQRQT